MHLEEVKRCLDFMAKMDMIKSITLPNRNDMINELNVNGLRFLQIIW